MILICVNHVNLRHLRAIFPDMTVAIDHFYSIAYCVSKIENQKSKIKNLQRVV